MGTATTVERGCFNINADTDYQVEMDRCYDLKSTKDILEILPGNKYYPGLAAYTAFAVKPCKGDFCNSETVRGAQFCDIVQDVNSVGFLKAQGSNAIHNFVNFVHLIPGLVVARLLASANV